ncbi:hypothetical protein ACFL26_02295 [Patescibacteria group bacterium]
MPERERAYDVTREALEKLKSDGRFERVRHARYFIAQDETAPCPNVLTFLYRHTQFFLDVGENGGARLRPAESGVQPIAATLQVREKGFIDDICRKLNGRTNRTFSINEYGERLMVRGDGGQRELKRIGYLIHVICGGCVDRSDISETHFALACRSCNLRLVVPRTVTTVDELERHFAPRCGAAATDEVPLPDIVFED